MSVIKLTAAQAMIRYISNQFNQEGEPFIAGCWGIFGHGNVAGIGEALYDARGHFKTYRGQNEQGIANAAIAYTKQLNRKRAMAVTTSIGPGATNLITSAALAHVNRLPILFIPGDVFANRAPDPVLQQIEDYDDATISVNDCFKPVSRYFDRITRPEQLLNALPRAFQTLTDPIKCGPVTLSFCQDVQAEAYDWPLHFFEPKIWYRRRIQPDQQELSRFVDCIKNSKNPVIIAGGGIHYSEAHVALQEFAEKHQVPVVETQAGKSALPWQHPLNFGAVGVTGTECANKLCEDADLILGIGTRFQDFTTGSWGLFKHLNRKLLSLNIEAYDAHKRNALPLQSDALVGINAISDALEGAKFKSPNQELKQSWFKKVGQLTDAPLADSNDLPTDQQVIGAVQRATDEKSVIMSAAGTMPGELHKLWQASNAKAYHMEYGYSCMGYEIAGAMGIKMAEPNHDVVCMLGDGSYMMLNSELATACMMGIKMTVILTDNRGYGCINRLQMGTGGAEFNNLLDDSEHDVPSNINFVEHARAMGAIAEKVKTIAALEVALKKAKNSDKTHVIVIDTNPYPTTPYGGHWWDVAVPEVSNRAEVNAARAEYENHIKNRNEQ